MERKKVRKEGTNKLPDKQKAEIIAEKRLGLLTVKQLAAKNQIVEATVYKTVREANEKVLKMADQIEKELAEKIKETRDLALNVIHKKLLNDEHVPLNHATTAFGVLYDKHALETGRPTARVEHGFTPERNAIEFFRVLLAKLPFNEALQAFRQATLAPLVSDYTRDVVADRIEADPKLIESMTD